MSVSLSFSLCGFSSFTDTRRGVAKLEAFSERLGQAAGRMELLGTLLRHKEASLSCTCTGRIDKILSRDTTRLLSFATNPKKAALVIEFYYSLKFAPS